MPSPPRRARFQIHLSTAIVLMFVAGGVIWANVTGKITAEGTATESHVHLKLHVTYWEYGWPITMAEYEDWRYIGEAGNTRNPEPKHYPLNAVVNLFTAVVTLFLMWFLCEWLIRRRAARKVA